MERAIVTAVDRRNGKVRLRKDGGDLSASFLTVAPPAPRSVVLVQQVADSQWVVLGSEAEQRVMLHDDFLSSGPPYYGDTNWFLVGTSGAASISGAPGVQGAVDIVTNPVANQYFGISKDNNGLQLPLAPAALWLSGVFRPDANAATPGGAVASFVGFANNPSSNGWTATSGASACGLLCAAVSPFVLNYYLRTIYDGASTDVDTGIPVTVGAHAFDLVVEGSAAQIGGSGKGLWAGLWVDGQGPTITTLNVPPTSVSKAPQVVATVIPFLNFARGITVDWLHLEYVGSIITP